MRKMEKELITHLLQLSDDDLYPSLIFEINAGAGGQEAMLFARELFEMYSSFFEQNGWEYEIIAQELTDIGGKYFNYFFAISKIFKCSYNIRTSLRKYYCAQYRCIQMATP